MEHSKGNWIAKNTNSNSYVYSMLSGVICELNNKPQEEAKANAKLIAAAPQMLEILTQVNNLLSEHQKQDSKILAGYTMAANLGDEATSISNKLTSLFRSIAE